MFANFSLFLATEPEETRDALTAGFALAHMAYQVGPGCRLMRGQIGSSMRGGLMVLSDSLYDRSDGSADALCDAVIKECASRSFEGLVLDFEGPPRKALERLAGLLDTVCAERGLSLYVNERYADHTKSGFVIVPTAIVSGSLRQKLEEAGRRYGISRVAVECERLSRDMLLPSPYGQGDTLDAKQLAALLEDRVTFYSQELCAHYFTYKTAEGTHFVLYDDARSLTQKLRLAHSYGVRRGFLLYPEVEDILPGIREGLS